MKSLSKGLIRITPDGPQVLKCPDCDSKNWDRAIDSGYCYYCGYDSNNDPEIIQALKDYKYISQMC